MRLVLVVLWLGFGCARIHNDPELVRKYEQVINSEKFRGQLLSMVDTGDGGMPKDSAHMFSIFSSIMSDAHNDAIGAENDLNNQLKEHVEGLPTKLSAQTKNDGHSIMMRKSGALLDALTDSDAARSSPISTLASRKIVENLSAGHPLDNNMLNSLHPTDSEDADILKSSMAGNSNPMFSTFDRKGHVSSNVKALAGVPSMPHVHFKDAYNLAIQNVPKDIHEERTHERHHTQVEKLKQLSPDPLAPEVPPHEDPVPYGARKAAQTMESIDSISESKDSEQSSHPHEKAFRALLGKKQSEILNMETKKGHHSDAVTLLEHLHNRLVDAKDDVMDGVFDRLRNRVDDWQNAGIKHLHTMTNKGNEAVHRGREKWKTIVLKHKFLKAQHLIQRKEF